MKTVVRNMGGFQMQQRVKVASEQRCKKESKELTLLIERGMGNGAQVCVCVCVCFVCV